MREAFLTRLAFGRSAFLPSECTETVVRPNYVQRGPDDQEIPQVVLDSDRYIQLYDERGNPINPGARKYGRDLRRAQNDVQVAAGVLERRLPPSSDLPASHNEGSEEVRRDALPLEREDAVGEYIYNTSLYVQLVAVWPIHSVSHRILTFGLPNAVPLSQVIASQGPHIIYAGLPAFALTQVVFHAVPYICRELRPLDRLLWNAQASRKTGLMFRRWVHVLGSCPDLTRLVALVALYPLMHHSILQRLGLLSASQFLPPWMAFIPFSPSSPICLPSLQSDLSVATIHGIVVMTLILALACFREYLEEFFDEAVYSLIPSPNNSGISGSLEEAADKLVLPSWYPSGIGRIVGKFWATIRRTRRHSSDASDESGDGRVVDIHRLDVPAAHLEVRPIPYHDNLAADFSQIDDRREVHREVPTLDQVVSSLSDPAENDSDASSASSVELAPRTRHRVSELSTGPPMTLSHMVKTQLIGWALLPPIALTYRYVASHYLGRHGNRVLHGDRLFWVPDPLNELRNLTLRSAGIMLSKVALCFALEVAIRFSLWGCQWAATTYIGKRYFGWGQYTR